MTKEEKNNLAETSNTRRRFLKNSGLALGGLVVGGAVGGLIVGNESEKDTDKAPTQVSNPNEALMYFYPDEFQTTVAASERIFPADDSGPGAAELNAAIYIDHQLVSQWGVNARDDNMGPWYKTESTRGDQFRLLHKDLLQLGQMIYDN